MYVYIYKSVKSQKAQFINNIKLKDKSTVEFGLVAFL